MNLGVGADLSGTTTKKPTFLCVSSLWKDAYKRGFFSGSNQYEGMGDKLPEQLRL